MKLRKLNVKGFRNHADSTLDMGDTKLVILRGGNFAGKSSIAQAISMLLTPSTDGLDSSGRGFATKIKRGESKAMISGEIVGKSHIVLRTVKLDTNTTGRTDRTECIDDPEWHPAPFDKFLETNRAALGVCLNTSAFMLMDEKSQKSLLAKLALPSHYDFPPEKMDAVEKALGPGQVNFTEEPFTVIEKAYKLLYAERQTVNRQVKEFVIPEAVSGAKVDSAELQIQLEAAQEKRLSIVAAKDVAVQKANAVEVQRAKLTTEVNALLQKNDEYKKAIAELDLKILSVEKLREIKELAEKKDERDQIARLIIESNGNIKSREAQIAKFRALPKDLKNCMSCGQSVTKEYIDTVIREAEEELSLARTGRDEQQKALDSIGDVDAALKSMAEHEAAIGERARKENERKEIISKGKAIRTELEKLGEKEDVVAQFTQPLEAADKTITALNEQLRPAIASEERAKEIATKKEQLARLEKKAKSLDDLVTWFGKDGIKAQLLADHVGGFENKMNSVLRPWGYKCSLSIEPYQFEVTDAKGITTPVRELSWSEQLLFTIALQCAVSQIAGIGMVVADRMDTLIPSERQKANKVLYGMLREGILEQVIEIMSDTSTEVPNLPDAGFWFVNDGAVERLGS